MSKIIITESQLKKIIEYKKAMIMETPYLNESVGVVKNGVLELFKSKPELNSIGTPEQYSNYLDTIFPNTKVKDIVYHGTMENLIPKDNFKGFITYFSDSRNYSETFGVPINRKVVSAVINIKSPYNTNSEIADVPEDVHATDAYTNPRIIKTNSKGFDSVIGKDAGQKEGRTIAVFEPEQIHMLGTKKDISDFKKFVNSSTNINENDRSKLVLAMAKLVGFDLSGYNSEIATKTLSSKDLLNKLGRSISNQKTLDDLISGLEEAGLKDAENTIKNNLKAIEHNFKLQAIKVGGVNPVVIPKEEV